MEEILGIVMAAGKGTRMKTEKAKCVHKVYDKEMVKRVVETAKTAGISEVIVVVGHKRKQVEEALIKILNKNK